MSTSTFITFSESVFGSGLLPVDGIKTPDWAEMRRTTRRHPQITQMTQNLLLRNLCNLWTIFTVWLLQRIPIPVSNACDAGGRAEVDILLITRDAEYRPCRHFITQPNPFLRVKIEHEGTIERAGIQTRAIAPHRIWIHNCSTAFRKRPQLAASR